jgi:hypothetical protein
MRLVWIGKLINSIFILIMRKTNCFLYLLFIVLSTGYAQKTVQESCRPVNPLEIDGKVNDWSAEWVKDADSKFWYNVCNDEENIYVRLKIYDGITQVKVARFGLTLWLDPNGKRKRKLGIKYPTPEGRDFTRIEKPQDLPDDKRTLEQKRLDMKRELINDTEVLELFGIADQKIISARLGLMNGIKVAIDMDDVGAYFYEAKIPFKAYKLDKSAIENLGIGFETGKLTATASSANIAAQRNYGSGNVAASNYRGNQYSPMGAETRLWITVKLKGGSIN